MEFLLSYACCSCCYKPVVLVVIPVVLVHIYTYKNSSCCRIHVVLVIISVAFVIIYLNFLFLHQYVALLLVILGILQAVITSVAVVIDLKKLKKMRKPVFTNVIRNIKPRK